MAFALMRWSLGIVLPYSGIHKYQSALMEELKLKYRKRDFFPLCPTQLQEGAMSIKKNGGVVKLIKLSLLLSLLCSSITAFSEDVTDNVISHTDTSFTVNYAEPPLHPRHEDGYVYTRTIISINEGSMPVWKWEPRERQATERFDLHGRNSSDGLYYLQQLPGQRIPTSDTSTITVSNLMSGTEWYFDIWYEYSDPCADLWKGVGNSGSSITGVGSCERVYSYTKGESGYAITNPMPCQLILEDTSYDLSFPELKAGQEFTVTLSRNDQCKKTKNIKGISFYVRDNSTSDQPKLTWDFPELKDDDFSRATIRFTYKVPKENFLWEAIAYDENEKEVIDFNGNVVSISDEIQIKTESVTDKEKKKRWQDKTCAADPIDLATGAQLLNHDLLTVQGVLPLSFSINYHSLLTNESILGRAWGHDRFDTSLQELSDGNIEVHWSTNQSNVFTKNADGSYNPSHVACRFDTLVKNADGGFTLTRKNQILYEFDAAGQLIALGNRQRQSLTFTRDELGRMTQVTEPVSGAFLRYAYNAEGLLETVSDPLERQVRFGYDSERNLTQIIDAAGQTTTYTYNELGQTLTGTNADGVQFFSNTYDDELRIVAQDDAVATNQEARLSFDDSQPERIITTFTNRNGQTQVYTYDDNSYLLSFQDELGNITRYTYDTNGKRTSTTDANGKTTQFAYNNNGNLTTSTDAKDNATQMVYDDNSNLLSVTDALGKTTTFTYDANNNRISATDALGNTTRYTYNSDGQVLTATSPSNAVTTYEYEKGLPVRVIDPEGNTQTSRYDAAGRLLSTTDAEGHTTTFAYDGVNRLVSVTDALNRTVSMTYDSRDNLLTSTDAKGNVTRRSYDGNGNLISQINALAQETRYEYDGESRLIKVIDAKAHVTQLGYDAKGRLISTTDALGNTQQLSYDAADNLLAEIDALGKTVATYSYDVLNNPISVTNALGHKTQSAYDALSRLTRVTDPLNWATQFNYDDSDRLVASVDAKGGQSSQAFDTEGNLTSLTDANSHQTTFQFDNNGRLVAESSASGGSVRYTYNARDLQTAVTNARGQQRQFEYDAVDRLTRLTDPDGTVSYTYDPNDNVLTVTDPSGTISREYDALDRVSKYTDSQGNTLQYAYDAVGNLETLTYPDGKQVFYEYDANDQLTQVTDWAERETRYVYDANGHLVEVVRSNGTQMTYTYDVAGQLVQQKDVASGGAVIRQFDFVYDAAGDIVKEQVVPKPAFFPFIPATMTYTAANHLATYNGEAVTFDADGNMTLGPLNGGLVTFAFDSRNRLSNVGDMAYRYDTENQRIAVSVAGQETRYVVNQQPVLSQTLVRTVPDGTQTFYVYGLGLISEETDDVYQAYHFDLRGSTVALSDEAGNVVEQFQYSPFGGLVSHNPADVDTPFLYNGRDGVITDDTGLYYMRARFYNPETRRFVNRDVLLGGVADGQSLNRFAYVIGDPISHIDPTGRVFFSTLGYLAYVGVPLLVRYAPVIVRSAQNAYRQALPVITKGAQGAYGQALSTIERVSRFSRHAVNEMQSAAYKYGHIITPRVEPIKDVFETSLMDGPYAASKSGKITFLLNNVIFNENLAADLFLAGVAIGDSIGKIIYCNSSEAPRIIHKELNGQHKVLKEQHTVIP